MDKVTKAYRLQKWAEAIQDCAASGLTVDEWCRLHSVRRDQYYYRLRAVRKAAAEQLSLTTAAGNNDTHTVFAEVSTTLYQEQDPRQELPQQPMPQASVCIRTGGAEILVTDNASEELLARIIKAVRSC